MRPEEGDILSIFLTAGLIFLLLAAAVVVVVLLYQRRTSLQKLKLQEMESAYQTELMRAMLATQEAERERIARNLHDEVGVMLSTARMSVQMVARQAASAPVEAGSFSDAENMLREAIVQVRAVSHELLPPGLQKQDLPTAMRGFCSKISQRTGVDCRTVLKGDWTPLIEQSRLSLYRIVQELTNNALKHAGATQIEFEMEVDDDGTLSFVYRDDGKGFDYERAKTAPDSLGLKNLETRVRVLNGTLDFQQRQDRGMVARITLPNVNAS